VPDRRKTSQILLDLLTLLEEIAHQNDEIAATPGRKAGRRKTSVSPLSDRLHRLELREQAREAPATAPRGTAPRSRSDHVQVDAVSLPIGEHRQCRHHASSGIELGSLGPRFRDRHRGGRIQYEADDDISLDLGLSDKEAVRPSVGAPIDTTEIVARFVGTKLQQLGSLARAGTAMMTGQVAVDQPLCHQPQQTSSAQSAGIDEPRSLGQSARPGA
jgi:hypothetical protein